jgi:hypothetical protein
MQFGRVEMAGERTQMRSPLVFLSDAYGGLLMRGAILPPI